MREHEEHPEYVQRMVDEDQNIKDWHWWRPLKFENENSKL